MLSLVSPDGRTTVAVDNDCGARLAALTIDGFDIIVPDGPDVFSWGCYPMAPYAGRVRDAVVVIDGSPYPLAPSAPPHAIHGTVLAVPWTVLEHQDSRALLVTDLDLPWPVEGTVRHDISLDNDGLTMRLDITAHDDMPCTIGWHPWFVRPESYTVPFRTLWRRDAHGIATRDAITHDPDTPAFGTYDDCLSDLVSSPELSYRARGLTITLDSDCSHWVVYDQPEHAMCLEPQSGPPNQINDDPVRLGFGETLSRTFRISWTNTPR